MEGYAFWSLAVLAAALVGASKGGLPMVGILAVPILALVIPAVTAAGLLLPVYVVSDMFGLWVYRKHFDKRVLAIILPGAVVGVGIGWATAHIVPEAAVTLLIGVIGLAFAANLLLRRPPEGPPRPAKVAPGLFWGVITGFTSFVSHSGAPPYQIYVQPMGLPTAVYAGTTTVFFAIVNAVKLIPYAALGQLNPDNLRIAAMLCLPAIFGVWLGLRLLRIIPQALFYSIITWGLLLVSVKLVWDGVTGLMG